ncbi:hypothetical protein JNB_00080 [Janibacter sp. HTCC2649]|nr:hypothetical protein JNB_00080 [Janibacter sp. HTCC2649]
MSVRGTKTPDPLHTQTDDRAGHEDA